MPLLPVLLMLLLLFVNEALSRRLTSCDSDTDNVNVNVNCKMFNVAKIAQAIA